MILLGSQQHHRLLHALGEVKVHDDIKPWERLVRHPDFHFGDPFLALLDDGQCLADSGAAQSHGAFSEWLTNADSWAQDHVLTPSPDVKSAEYSLYIAWESLTDKLREALRVGRQVGTIPAQGGVLAFIGGLSYCVIFDFTFHGAVPDLKVVAAIAYPKSVFDFWGAIDNADVSARNHLKRILASGEKLVWVRNVLTHVDRRQDAEVFGPSIDTVVLVELLGQLVLDEGLDASVALEVGCGNGMISCAIAAGMPKLTELFAIDTSHRAISCAHRNVLVSLEFSQGPPPQLYFLLGPYKRKLIDRQFDLVVCNPPYVPYPLTERKRKDGLYLGAIGGTDLLSDVIQDAPSLLSLDGRMLVMTSSLCLDQAQRAVPEGLVVEQPLGDEGLRVLFDVEAVVEDEEWLKFLLDSGALEHQDGFYYHSLHPLWVRRSS